MADLKELRSLSLSRDWRMTDKGLADLLALPGVRTLDLSECLHVGGAELVKGLSSPQPRAQLESLSLRNCTYIRVSTEGGVRPVRADVDHLPLQSSESCCL